jgi:hypothetical protein
MVGPRVSLLLPPSSAVTRDPLPSLSVMVLRSGSFYICVTSTTEIQLVTEGHVHMWWVFYFFMQLMYFPISDVLTVLTTNF